MELKKKKEQERAVDMSESYQINHLTKNQSKLKLETQHIDTQAKQFHIIWPVPPRKKRRKKEKMRWSECNVHKQKKKGWETSYSTRDNQASVKHPKLCCPFLYYTDLHHQLPTSKYKAESI